MTATTIVYETIVFVFDSDGQMPQTTSSVWYYQQCD